MLSEKDQQAIAKSLLKAETEGILAKALYQFTRTLISRMPAESPMSSM